ncbi:fatty acid--CoA ligase [Cupriavidus sp. 2TAF22]|uniref:fatty acid--CoA ligase n=1 Tax=unclassified Cupriavidus TaxID=2640874 RepID=UPI003F8ED12D
MPATDQADNADTAHAPDYQLLIRQLLLSPLSYAPGQEIVYRDAARYTYRTLGERIGRLASGLASLGVGYGDTVAILDWDSHRYLECFFAVPMMGAVLQTVNVRLSPEHVRYTLAHAAPKVMLVHHDFLDLVLGMRDQLPSVEHVVVIDDGHAASQAPAYEALLAASAPDFAFRDFSENTRATVFYTSGTTGLPKGVYYTHRQIVLHTLAVVAMFAMPAQQGRFHRGDVYMPITPMFHVHAWGMPYAATMMGVKQVYPGRYSADQLLQLQQREGVTFSHCVPTILHMLLAEAQKTQSDLAGWKIIVGGAALSKSLAGAALARGIDVFCGYGMSETCPFITSAQVDEAMLAGEPAEWLPARLSAGRPLPLVDLRLADPQMAFQPHDGESAGEIVLRAPWLTPGYLGDDDASRKLWTGGYLHTGDIGTIDAGGYLRISDRLKDVIKTGGEWISSYAVEDCICQHPSVSEAAVIGVSDEKWGERPMALVVLKSPADESVSADAIRAHLHAYVASGTISRYAVPERYLFVASLPRTSVGKYDKKAMRAALA